MRNALSLGLLVATSVGLAAIPLRPSPATPVDPAIMQRMESQATESKRSKKQLIEMGRVEELPNVRRAAELLAMGRRAQAEELLRHQAKICNPAEHRALVHIAEKLNLPGAQFWLAHFGQPGARVEAADRYPMPNWTPYNGWRVDPAPVI